jgi:type IV pilus assembly protein PilC
MPDKKAGEFLLDTQLGEKKFDLKNNAVSQDEPLILNIEGATPAALIAAARSKRVKKKISLKALYAKLDAGIRSFGSASPRDIATFFRLLAVMLNAGIPLVRSLDVISEQTINRTIKDMIYQLARGIEQGGNLSDAMAHQDKIFSDGQIGMIHAGEASGKLNEVLQDLATEVEKLASIRKKVRGALIYPAFIMIVLIGVVSGMLIFVVPKIAEVFSETGSQLPLVTRIVISASDLVSANWPVILIVLLAVIIGLPFAHQSRLLRRPLDELILHIPILGQLLSKSLLARFARSLSNLLRSGIPIIESLKINAKTMGNEVYKERILLAGEDLSRGIPLGESLRDSPLFPPLFVQMIAIGEQTAQIDNVSLKVADYYEEEVDISVANFTKILEPFIIVAVGLSVGVIVMAIMFPIIKLIDVSSAL